MWEKIKRCLPKRVNRFSQSESGTAAVEFAFVAFPFFMLLGMIIEQGVVMFAEYTLQSAVQSSSRLVRTGQAQSGGLTAQLFKDKICALASMIDCAGGVTVHVESGATFAALRTSIGSITDVGVSGKADGTAAKPPTYSCGGRSDVAVVIATYDYTFNFGFMNFYSNLSDKTKRRLVGFAMFQNEPFPSGTACK
jgi:TadE-like protein